MNVTDIFSGTDPRRLSKPDPSSLTEKGVRNGLLPNDEILISTVKNNQVEFYTYEEAPWESRGVSKTAYTESLRGGGQSSLNSIYKEYSSFKQDLAYTHPELANKYFGFSMRADLSIAVTDPDNVLTDAELSFLSEKMNQLDKLKEHMRGHARAVLELVDHDDMFEGRYSLTLNTFQSVIDYGAIFCRNPANSFTDAWIDQVERGASQREKSLINVKV